LVKALAKRLPQEELADLQCPQCGSMLNDPWTLGSGRTVCSTCVTRAAGEHVPPVANRLVDKIAKTCLPQAAEAAAKRLSGNGFFKAGEWEKAIAAYSEAMRLDPTSSAAVANRSFAKLKLQRSAEAVDDAAAAVALRPLWSKWHLRLAAALRSNGQHEEAIVSLLRSAALDQADNVCVKAGTRVKIQGLQQASKFNNAQGRCVKFDAESGRWDVRLQSGRDLRLKPEHLLVMGSAADQGARKELAELTKEGYKLPPLDSLTLPSPLPGHNIPVELVMSIREDFDCCLCSALICEPTVLPCGHCMCRECVARLLDHALHTEPKCPLCRVDLMPLLRQVNLRARENQRSGLRFAHGAAQLTVCSELAKLLAQWFPKEYTERIAEQEPQHGEWVPIFVCSLSAPFIPTPLHVFEPRYRLMMRRAVESNQRFGMCLPDANGSFADAGTMLFIDRFEQLPDGRSMIGTKGVSRFTVLERSTLDGYSTALIRTFHEDAQGFPTSARFHADALALHTGARTILGGLQRNRPQMMTSIEHQLGSLPEIESPQFDAHMSFYIAQMLQVFNANQEMDASDLVFAQPEERRWQLLLDACSQFQPLGDALVRPRTPSNSEPCTPQNDSNTDKDVESSTPQNSSTLNGDIGC